jgi:phage terminase large subunit-like protein
VIDTELERIIRVALQSKDPDILVAAHKLISSPYYSFKPRPDQPQLLDEQSSFVFDQFPGIACIIGGNGSGKTVSAAYKVARFIRNTPPPDKETRFWVVCQKMDMAAGVCWSQHLEKFLPEAVVTNWYKESRGWPEAVEFKHASGNKWVIEFRSYEQGRKALQAASIGGFWADEQIDHSLLAEINSRTRNYRFSGNKLYTLTPLAPDPELEKLFTEAEKHPDWKFYRLNSECNTTIDLSFLNTCLDEQRETRRTGAFGNYTGAIYKTFNTAQHVVDPFPIPRGWRHVAGIDFGWDHPTVVILAARDLAGRYYVYDEYVENKTSIEDHVKAIKEKWKVTPDHGDIWADHAAAQDRHEFSIRGLPTRQAHKDVIAGIAKIQQLLRVGPDGTPGLVIFKNCTNLIRDLRTYVWHPNIPNKVLKKNDDCADALRYLVFSEGAELKPVEGLNLQQNRFFKKVM